MDRTRDELGIIRWIIEQETVYLRHYIGQVFDNNDSEQKGRVLVNVPELGWFTQEQSAWCWPRQLHGLTVPIPGEWVEVYFINGNRNRPVYIGNVSEITGQTPKAYDGTARTVIFQDPTTDEKIDYDKDRKLLSLLAGTEAFVLGNKLKTYLDSIASTLSLHTHAGVSPGGSVTSPGPALSGPTDVLSSKIKGE